MLGSLETKGNWIPSGAYAGGKSTGVGYRGWVGWWHSGARGGLSVGLGSTRVLPPRAAAA